MRTTDLFVFFLLSTKSNAVSPIAERKTPNINTIYIEKNKVKA